MVSIALQKSSVPLFTSDTNHCNQSRLHPQVRIGDVVAPLKRTPKILGVALNTHFTLGPHAHDCVKRTLGALNVMKALVGLSWGFMNEALVATYKAVMRPIINYAAPSGSPNIFSAHLDKLEVIQNKALRIATGCCQKAAACDLRAETGVLPLRAHLELCSQQFYARPPSPTHQSHNCHPIPALSGLPSRPHTTTVSEVCESEVTTPKPPPSSGACWKRAPIPWPDDSSDA